MGLVLHHFQVLRWIRKLNTANSIIYTFAMILVEVMAIVSAVDSELQGNTATMGVSVGGNNINSLEISSPGLIRAKRNAVNSEERLWPGGVVPYIISDAYDREERRIIARGMRSIMGNSCIEFVPRTTENDYVYIMSGKGCFSEIGRMKGKQQLSLKKNGCVTSETVIHELMHTLGFDHEHNRPDRDNYIQINVDNLEDGAIENFKKCDPTQFHSYTRYSYDFNSIMHFKAFAYAKNKTIPTIKSVDRNQIIIGSVNGFLSQLDELKLNKLYNCDFSLTLNCPVKYLGNQNNQCFNLHKYGCYCIVKERKTRADAVQFCKSHKTELVWFRTKEERKKLYDLMEENELVGFWTSGVDRNLDGEWHWDQGMTSGLVPVTDFNWCAKSPDNYNEDEFYIAVRNHMLGNICWEDYPNDSLWPAICKSTKIAHNLTQEIPDECTEKMLDKQNRDGESPRFPLLEDLRLKTSNILVAHEIIRKALRQFFNFKETFLGTYLNYIIQSDLEFIDEYGEKIHSYYKVFNFIWEQFNETLCQNYAITQYDKDKLDLCSVARFLSHQQEVRESGTIMEKMGEALGYQCPPCTPYKRKEFGETVIQNTDHLNAGISPEESYILCKEYNHYGQMIPSSTASSTTTFTTTKTIYTSTTRPTTITSWPTTTTEEPEDTRSTTSSTFTNTPITTSTRDFSTTQYTTSSSTTVSPTKHLTIWDLPNRDGVFPQIPPIQDLRLHSSYIVNAHEILRRGLQEFLVFKNETLDTYLHYLVYHRTEPFVNEYGKPIRLYKKILRFIWQQYNETSVQNYAINYFDRDKLDLCSVARFLSHQPTGKNRQTIMKRMGDVLDYQCHPCTPYRRKEHSDTIIPSYDGISSEGMSPEESRNFCERYQED